MEKVLWWIATMQWPSQFFSRAKKRMNMSMTEDQYNNLTGRIIGAAIEVHRQLGAGLMESVYENCLMKELLSQRICVQQQVHLPICYKGQLLDKEYIIDILVENEVILELKAVENILPLHKAQLLSLLKLSGKHLGLLINFNVVRLKEGIHRMISGSLL
jgi:GxxExxY protein